MAQALIAACEAVALAAGFPDLYIQAAITVRDPGSPLGGWLSQVRGSVVCSPLITSRAAVAMGVARLYLLFPLHLDLVGAASFMLPGKVQAGAHQRHGASLHWSK